MLDLAILGLLEENDLHGYELRKRLGDLLGLRLAISFGSLYPALGRLEKAGLVKAVTSRPGPRRAPRPDERVAGRRAGRLPGPAPGRRPAAGAAPGARRSTASPTPGGSGCVELLADPDVSDDRAFPLRVAFCRNLRPPSGSRCSSGGEPSWRSGPTSAARGPAGDGRVNTYLRSLRERDTRRPRRRHRLARPADRRRAGGAGRRPRAPHSTDLNLHCRRTPA